jgi:hypothetical protein
MPVGTRLAREEAISSKDVAAGNKSKVAATRRQRYNGEPGLLSQV